MSSKAQREIRFGVGKERGARSTAWKLWTTTRTDDIYLSCRSHEGEFKISLHESGDYRAAFSEKVMRDPSSPIAASGNRFLRRWSRPDPMYEGGPVPALTIVVPWFSLHGIGEPSGEKDTVRVPAPPEGDAVEFTLLLRLPGGAPTWPLAGMFGLGALAPELKTGRSSTSVGLYVRTRTLRGYELEHVEEIIDHTHDAVSPTPEDAIAQHSCLVSVMTRSGAACFLDILVDRWPEELDDLPIRPKRAFVGRASMADLRPRQPE